MLLDLKPILGTYFEKAGGATLVAEASGAKTVENIVIIQRVPGPVRPEHPGFVFNKSGGADLVAVGGGEAEKGYDLVSAALTRRPDEEELLLIGAI